MARMRLDQLLVERTVFPSRARAAAAIAAGRVRIGGSPARKAAQMVEADTAIEAEPEHDYVSRGALKLAAALDAAGIDPSGAICLDLGASTGGFTDLLLRRGAKRVFAVDVGHGQLHAALRDDPRVVALEGLDARAITPAEVPEPVDLLVADLAFIGLAKALPAGLARVKPGGRLVGLVKPQFEAGPGAGKKGVIRDPALQAAVLDRVAAEIAALGVTVEARLPSPIAGGDGNREFLIVARKAA
ncbi:TlyA family RNA methyltransferase [Rhabdaerophilum calidifontis]|uniref:TlyA family RNA methyltransferase n=1 Tax=Rhabdaerophilum calidifontis TaxID=2604328 RepID=UPI00123ABFBA|nr:TlyA family RNA methyltransferase [Rhabdaerophilum calidifontis]